MNSPKSHANRHSRTRRDHATELAEDYVEAIAEFIENTGTCRGRDLAAHFEVSHVTVNRTIGRLQRDGYVSSEPYGPINLTKRGKRLAIASCRRHEVVLSFLLALGITEETARLDAEGIEHHVSDETLRTMREYAESCGYEFS